MPPPQTKQKAKPRARPARKLRKGESDDDIQVIEPPTSTKADPKKARGNKPVVLDDDGDVLEVEDASFSDEESNAAVPRRKRNRADLPKVVVSDFEPDVPAPVSGPSSSRKGKRRAEEEDHTEPQKSKKRTKKDGEDSERSSSKVRGKAKQSTKPVGRAKAKAKALKSDSDSEEPVPRKKPKRKINVSSGIAPVFQWSQPQVNRTYCVQS